jgi:hypothetical protein
MIRPGVKHYLLLLLSVASYLLTLSIVRPWGNFPLNDDWVYARDCVQSARAGHLELTKFESAWSLPQIVVGSLAARAFGFSHSLFRWTGIASLIGTGLLVDCYLRRLGQPSGVRLAAFGAWLFNPVAYILSLSFMTDLPFVMLWVAACYCWDRALTGGGRRWVVAAAVTTMVAMAQRQFALFIPFAVGFLVVSRWAIGRRRVAEGSSTSINPAGFQASSLIAATVTVAYFGAFWIWWSGSGGNPAPIQNRHWWPMEYPMTTYRIAMFFGLSSVPVLLMLTRSSLSRLATAVAAAAMIPAATFGANFILKGKFPLFANYFSPYGLFGEVGILLGDREVIFDANLNRVADLAGLIALFAMIRLLVGAHLASTGEFPPSPEGGEVTPPRAIGGFGGVLFVASAMTLPVFLYRGDFFDRYLLPCLSAALVALAWCVPVQTRLRRAAAAAALVAMAAFSSTIAADYFRWNEARWAAASWVASTGVPANRIQAGYEWNGEMVGETGFPSTNPMDYDYIVSFSGDIAGFEEVEAVPWRSIWPPHDRKLHVLKRKGYRGPGER